MRDFKYKGFSSKELYSTVRDKFVVEERKVNGDENLTSGKTYIYKPVRIKKINQLTNEVVPFKKMDLDYLNRWLLNNKDYEILEIDKYLYKAIFFPYGDDYTKGAKDGYVDLKVRLYKNALSCILVSERTLTDRIIENTNDNEKYLCIDNRSNVEGLIIYPNFVISNIPRKGFRESRKIIIENTSITNNIITLSLEDNEKIYINGKNDYIESNKNRLVNKIGEYIKLQNGINTIKIKSDGYCRISISHQSEFNIEGAWDLG